jgi:ankyrin repeat protein
MQNSVPLSPLAHPKNGHSFAERQLQDLQDIHGRTPLHVAASSGATHTTVSIVHRQPSAAAAVDVHGDTPLDNAVNAGDDAAVAILRRAGAPRGSDEGMCATHERFWRG